MADQTRKPKPKKEEEAPQASETTSTEEKDEELDDLLDEIDEVLESNAEDFVRSFIQKGGQLVAPIGLFIDAPAGPSALVLLAVALIYVGRQQLRSI
jgi:prokaryotic ubiquitin-like protein Pup